MSKMFDPDTGDKVDLIPPPDVLAKQFGEWVRTKPFFEKYNYQNRFNCAFAQFLMAKNIPVRYVGDLQWADRFGQGHDIDPIVRSALALHPFGSSHFGTLRIRLWMKGL